MAITPLMPVYPRSPVRPVRGEEPISTASRASATWTSRRHCGEPLRAMATRT